MQLRRELDEVAESAAGVDVELGLADVTALLRSRLAGRPTRASFRTGTLTVCTLVPMRSVPHRVVCLLGMDDGAFPRQGVADGDDILAREPRSGERDVRRPEAPFERQSPLRLLALCCEQIRGPSSGALMRRHVERDRHSRRCLGCSRPSMSAWACLSLAERSFSRAGCASIWDDVGG